MVFLAIYIIILFSDTFNYIELILSQFQFHFSSPRKRVFVEFAE